MKKKFLLLFSILCIGLLTGCGIQLTSKMKLNANFVGTRTMSCSIRISDLKNNFDGNADDVDKIIQASCPSSLSYTKKEKSDVTVYTFYLNFKSKADYKKKVGKLLNFSPEISYTYATSPFVHGVKYKENFTSKDLMSWLFTAFYEKGYVDKDHADDLWDLKETLFYFDGTEYKTKDKISVNSLTYQDINRIDLATTQNKDHTYQRTISIQVPQTTLDKKRSQIESYFGVVGTKQNWTNDKNGKTLHISFTTDSFTDLCALTRKVLHSSNSYGRSNLETKKTSPFSLQETFQEELDYRNFVDSSGKIDSSYQMTANGKTKTLDESSKQTVKVHFTASNQMKVTSYEVTALYKSSDNIHMFYNFNFDQAYSNRELKKLKNAFSGKTFSSVKLKNQNHKMTLQVIQTGSVDACSMDLHSVFSSSSIKEETEKSILKGNQTKLSFHLSLGTNTKNSKGTFQFISLSSQGTSSLHIDSKNYKKNKVNQHVIQKEYADYMSANDTLQSIHAYTLSSDCLDVTYTGDAAAHYWLRILRVIIPLLALLFLSMLLYKKQKVLISYGQKLKKWLEKKME